MAKVLRIISNKYFLATAIMLTWIVFFDRYNAIRRWEDQEKLDKLREEKAYYESSIEEVRRKKEELFGDDKKLEKFARERYYMKKKDEDVYIVEE
jgi:cell division protein DivIC